jgi:hypothetical protein
MQELHETLVTLRDTVLAHSDLGPIDAKIVYGDEHEPLLIKNKLPKFSRIKGVKPLLSGPKRQHLLILSSSPRRFIKACY